MHKKISPLDEMMITGKWMYPSLKTRQTQKVDGSSKIQTFPKSGEAIPNVSK
jgi:hypothetical protein